MPEKMLKTAGRYKDTNGVERASAPYVSEDGVQKTTVDDTTLKSGANNYLHSTYVSDILDTALTGEILKGKKLQWFFPLTENKGVDAYDFSGNGQKARIFGNRMTLNEKLGLQPFRYLSRTTNDKLGKLNVFGEHAIHAVELPNDLSVAGKQTVTFQCVFEPIGEETRQNLIAERTHETPSGVDTVNKLQIAYNFNGDRRILVGFRTKHPSEQGLQIVRSTVIEADRELILLHVSINLITKKVFIYIDGKLDSEHNLDVEGDAFLDIAQKPMLGNYVSFVSGHSLRGQAGFFAMHENILTPAHIQKQYQSFFKSPNVTEGGETVIQQNTVIYKDTFAGKYEIHVDDTILALEELDASKDTYTSIFEAPIFKFYKAVHDKYGTVFNLSLFYEVVSTGAFGLTVPSSQYRIGWNLSQMTDKFKSEFMENADWIRFSFHSQNYDIRYADEDNRSRSAWEDYKKVRDEVRRFAGNISWESNYTKLHWYSATTDQMKELADNGVHQFIGSAQHAGFSSLHLTGEQTAEMHSSGHFHHEPTGTTIVTGSGVIERILGKVPAGVGEDLTMDTYLDRFTAKTEPWKKSTRYISIETHEQWFYGDMDVYDQIEVAAKWFFENNYKPEFMDIHYAKEALS